MIISRYSKVKISPEHLQRACELGEVEIIPFLRRELYKNKFTNRGEIEMILSDIQSNLFKRTYIYDSIVQNTFNTDKTYMCKKTHICDRIVFFEGEAVEIQPRPNYTLLIAFPHFAEIDKSELSTNFEKVVFVYVR